MLAVVLAAVGLLVAAGSAAAADPVTFGQPTAASTFGTTLEFKQPVTLAGSPLRVEILVETPGAIGPTVVPIPPPATGESTLDYKVDLSGGNVVPNTTFTARWRVTDTTCKAWLGPSLDHVYADDRFDWKTLKGDVVRVHWVEGDQAFGRRALKIGDDAVAATAKLLGVTESDPLDFFIYADQQAFYDALGPATRENVGGQAHPDIRTLFALIVPADIDAGWVESVVPPELTHVVFQTAIDNPYHEPPHWLNEGLAVYLSDGYSDFDRAQVAGAVSNGTIIPLDGLAGAFPTTEERFNLAYAESVSTVDRIIRVNGREALVKLIRSYHDGVSDDDAFRAALGRDVAGFQSDWLKELGATPPRRLGPKPAPVGPLPSGWQAPQPDPSFEIVGSAAPQAPAAPAPGRTGNGDDAVRFLVAPLATLGLVVLVVIAAVGVRRLRRGRPDPARWAETGDNRLFGRPSTGVPAGDPSTGADAPDRASAGSRLWSATDWSLPREPDGDGPDDGPTDARLGQGGGEGAGPSGGTGAGADGPEQAPAPEDPSTRS